LQTDNLNWRAEGDIENITPRLSYVYFAMRAVTPLMKTDRLSLLFILLSCGVIFWGNSTDRKKIFTFQKKIISLIKRIKSPLLGII
jgi:hypothetical protein